MASALTSSAALARTHANLCGAARPSSRPMPKAVRLVVRAEPEEKAAAAPEAPKAPADPLPTTPKEEVLTPEEEKKIKEGQGVAVVTGGISLILGIAYLALVTLLDSRGNELLPPPPEAFL